MTTLVTRVAAEANQIRFWPTVLLVLTSVLLGIGWSAYHAVTLLWTVAVWCAAGVKVGWQDAASAAQARREASDGDRRLR